MVQKTYYKTKEYCKVKFSFAADAAETIEILGLNSDWKKFCYHEQEERRKFQCRH